MRRILIVLVMLCAALLFSSAPAIASEVETDRVVTLSGVSSIGGAAELSHTFSKQATQRIYSTFKSGGAAGATAYCIYIAPTPMKPMCATMIVILYELTGAPPAADDCYQVYARFGWPPTGGRIIKC